MKILVIPDIHLKPYMFTRADELLQKNVAETAVCLMDIPDDWDQQFNIDLYNKTYSKAIQFAKDYPETLWCYGNHDLSYIWGEVETGYSSFASSTVCKKLIELNRTVRHPIQYVQKIDNVLFCHGGLSDDFVRKNVHGCDYDDVDTVLKKVNSFGDDIMWADDSPIWLRPQYGDIEMYKNEDLLQVVGHTPVRGIDKYYNLISCDVFSTYQDGRPIGSQEFLLLDTETWEHKGIK